MSKLRVCFAYKNAVIEDWENTEENPVTMIPCAGDAYQTRIDGKLIAFDVVYALWSEQNYVMIVLSNARNALSGVPVDL